MKPFILHLLNFTYTRSAVTSAILAFVSTSIDDFAVMLVFFVKANKLKNENGITRLGDLESLSPLSSSSSSTSSTPSRRQGGQEYGVIGDVENDSHNISNHRTLLISAMPVSTSIETPTSTLIDTSAATAINYEGYAKVVAGQTLGFTIVILISLIGVGVGLLVPKDIISLIGLFPLLMGLYKFYEIMKEKYCSSESTEDSAPQDTSISTSLALSDDDDVSSGHSADVYNSLTAAIADNSNIDSNAGNIEMGSHVASRPASSIHHPTVDSSSRENEESGRVRPVGSDQSGNEEEEEENDFVKFCKKSLTPILDPFVLEVTTMALICSSDNISIYIALFASTDLEDIAIIIAVFYGLLFFNVVLALGVMSCPKVVDVFQRYSDYIIPFFLVGLGLDILSDSVIWP